LSSDEEPVQTLVKAGVARPQLLWLPSYAEERIPPGDLNESSQSIPNGKKIGKMDLLKIN
jgi:hypothetical protein